MQTYQIKFFTFLFIIGLMPLVSGTTMGRNHLHPLPQTKTKGHSTIYSTHCYKNIYHVSPPASLIFRYRTHTRKIFNIIYYGFNQ